ncbi:MAG: hypothetical protein GF398_07205 [Chitinivibrionales bacterium]|nr:hypothetical protein [Chitinivibrionales bacterium]
MLRTCIVSLITGLTLAVSPARAACPSFAKTNGSEGSASDLPDGFFAYGHNKKIMLGSLRSNNAQAIPNVSLRVHRIFISGDGNWILVHDGQKLIMMNKDGSVKEDVPGSSGSGGHMCGFVRKSPTNAMEVFYGPDDGPIMAKKVTASGNFLQFGSERTLISGISFNNGEMSNRSTCVSGNHLFTGVDDLATWVTIPDKGSGTAGGAELWTLQNPPQWNCGYSMSHDGSLVCYNPGTSCSNIPGCLPTDNGGHRGVVMLPFFEKNTAGASRCEMYASDNMISINFAPTKHTRNFDWHMYQWTNHREYLICRMTTSFPNYSGKGLWVLHWPSNTWTRVSDGTIGSETFYSAAHIATATPVHKAPTTVHHAATPNRTDSYLYDIRGRMISPGMPEKTQPASGIVINPNGVASLLSNR